MPLPHDGGMMSQQLDFAILTAPLAAVDRRALSQAWYSALHLAAASRGPSGDAPAPQCVRGSDASSTQRIEQKSSKPAAGTPRTVASQKERAGGALISAERRALRSPLARRIERAFHNPVQRSQRATFTVDGTRARVHVTLQSSPAGARIVAVCPPAVRAGVARALEQARYALAARGVALHVDVNEA